VTAGVQIGAGLLLASGKLPRLSSAALAVSVVPGSLGSHAFWNETDPARKAAERRALFSDVSLIGGLIIASVDLEGRPSLGWRSRRAARKVSERVTSVLPSETPNALIDPELVDKWGEGLQSGLHVGAERGRELAHVAYERGSELADVALERGSELADVARDRAPKLAKKARKRGLELAELTQDRSTELADVAQKRGAKLVDVARDRAPELVEAARDRGAELAALAQDRSNEFASLSRKQAKQTRKDLKRAQKELEKRVR